MASGQDRLKLKRESCDTWSTREQLCLASSVLKSGDQNWSSVSKSLKPFAEKESLRPADWFSSKSCAIQYAALVENADTPKRKKRDHNDVSGVTTIGTAIVRRLTAERISELRQILAFQRDDYQQLKQEVNLLKSGSISEEKLQKMWQATEQEDREAEQKERAHSAWLAKRQQKQESSAKETANLSTPKKTLEIPCEPVDMSDDAQETEEDRKNQGGRSPLLTSLLKSPSPTTQVLNATSTAQTTSPTIASLLGATTKPQTSHVAQNLTSQLNQIVVKSISSPMPSITSLTSMSAASGKEERPSVGAPTLSMMLQLPSNIPRSLPSQLNNNSTPTTPVVSSAPLRNIKTNVNETVTRTASVPLTPVVDNSPAEVIEATVADVTDTETLTKSIDKDEINEIIDDIEELIKEEISPEAKAASVSIVKPIKEEEKEKEGEEEPVVHTINQEKIHNLDESESPDLDSSKNDITMELIEQDTSKIAEIIGASPEVKTPSPLVEPEKPMEIKIECVEEKKEEDEEKISSSVVTIKEKVEDVSTEKKDEEIKTEVIVEENNVPDEKVEEEPEVVEQNKEKESTNDCVVEKDTTEEVPAEKDIVNEEKEIEEKEQEQEDKKEQEKDVEIEKEDDKKQEEDKKAEEKEEKVTPVTVEVEEPKKEEEKVEEKIESLIEVKETEAKEKEQQQQQQDEDKIKEENIVEKIIEKPKESNDVVKIEKSTEVPSILEDNKSVQEIAKETGPSQDIKAECKEETIEVEEKKDIVSQSTIKLEVEESKESLVEVKVENNTNEPIVKEAIVSELSKTSSPPNIEDVKKEKKEIPKILDKPSEINSLPISTKSKPTTPKISKPSEDKKVEIKIIKSVQEDQATDVEDKIPHSKIPIRMDINDDNKKNDNNKTIDKIDKEIKIEDSNKKDIVKIKKQETPSVSSIDDIEEEESTMTKLSGRAIKTYSKKQNVTIDSEPETDTSEGADYRAWKKAIILVFNRLATHRFSSLFLKPITEENAPGYHSVVFRPMDLSTIKKNIDNGTIRTTTQFQRDVMLMFQNAIMYNKHDTRVHKMTLDMQEECLEQMQVLVEVAAEGPLRRETRTAANSSISEANDNNILKRKRSLITPSPLDSDSPRFKKRRKSEND